MVFLDAVGQLSIVMQIKNEFFVRPNQSLKLTAEAQVQTRNAQKMGHYKPTRRDMSSEVRVVHRLSYQRRSLAPVR